MRRAGGERGGGGGDARHGVGGGRVHGGGEGCMGWIVSEVLVGSGRPWDSPPLMARAARANLKTCIMIAVAWVGEKKNRRMSVNDGCFEGK